MLSIDQIYVCTNVLAIPGSDQNIFWFGRIDRTDGMRPLKIVADGPKTAWDTLEAHYIACFKDGLDHA